MYDNEPLDFCRVKKIFDKGFGFLTSLYYDEPVFFHFNKVKDPSVKEKLEKLKRGEVYFFFTSILYKGRRRVYKLWLDVKDIEKQLIPGFIERIIEELNSGTINIFELTRVLQFFRDEGLLTNEQLLKSLSSSKLLKTPSAVLTILNKKEKKEKEELEKLLHEYEEKGISKDQWLSSTLNILIKE